jgi:hypothetical protein
MSKQNKGMYKGLPWESENELWFLEWAFELKDFGYIRSIKRSDSYVLTEGMVNTYSETKRASGVAKQQVILKPSVYTPEFIIVWNKKALDNIVWIWGSKTKFDKLLIGHRDDSNNIFTIIECKSAGYDFHNMTRIFKNNQKFLWDKHKIFVNLVQPKDFFQKCFYPGEFFKTLTGKPRKVNFKYKLIKQFLGI